MESMVLVVKAVGEADGSGRGAGVGNKGFGWFLTTGVSEGEGGTKFVRKLNGFWVLTIGASIGGAVGMVAGETTGGTPIGKTVGGEAGSKIEVGTTPVGYKVGGAPFGNGVGLSTRTTGPTMGAGAGTGAKKGAKVGSMGVTPPPPICVRTSKSKWSALELNTAGQPEWVYSTAQPAAKLNQAIRTAAMYAAIIMHFGQSSRIRKATSQPL
jgi:hypothetical protein